MATGAVHGKGRDTWDFGRQNAEQELRRELRRQGTEPPRQCPGCGEDLEAYKDVKLGIVVRCVGRCGKSDGRSALEHLRAAGAPVLPGFEL